MISYKQIFPAYVDYKQSDIRSGELDKLTDIFKLSFIKHHVDFDNNVYLRFRSTTKPSTGSIRINVWVEYPSIPAVSHIVCELTLSQVEYQQNESFLSTPHPLLMQKIYSYLQEKKDGHL